MSNFGQSDPPAYTHEIAVMFHPKDAGSEPLDLDPIGHLVDLEVAEPESLRLGAMVFHLVARLLRPN